MSHCKTDSVSGFNDDNSLFSHSLSTHTYMHTYMKTYMHACSACIQCNTMHTSYIHTYIHTYGAFL